LVANYLSLLGGDQTYLGHHLTILYNPNILVVGWQSKLFGHQFDLGQLFLVNNEIHPNPLLHKFLILISVSGLGISHPHWI
jgi:hypothetical protein